MKRWDALPEKEVAGAIATERRVVGVTAVVLVYRLREARVAAGRRRKAFMVVLYYESSPKIIII